MVTEEDQIQIEKWLEGSLPPAQAERLSKRAEKDPDLAKAMRRARMSQDWLEREAAVSQTMDYLQRTYPTSKKPSPRTVPFWRRPRYLAAASILLLLSVGLFWVLSTENTSIESPHRPLPATMGSSEEAVRAYNDGDFKVALPLIQQQLDSTPEPRWLLAEAVSLLELGRYDEASVSIERLAERAPLQIDAVTFYRGLIAYRKNQFESARSALEAVPEDTYYYAKARALLEEI